MVRSALRRNSTIPSMQEGYASASPFTEMVVHPSLSPLLNGRFRGLAAGLLLCGVGCPPGADGARAAETSAAVAGTGEPSAPTIVQGRPAGPAQAQESDREPSPWAATVELYGFAPLRTTGSSTVRGFSTDIDLELGQVLRPLTGAALIRGSVERGRFGLLTDISYVSVKGEQGRLTDIRTRSIDGPRGRSLTLTPEGQRSVEASIGNIQGIYDLALRYRFGDRESAVARPGSVTVIPYAGVRIVDIKYELAVQSQGPGRNLTFQGPRLQGSRTLSGWNLKAQQAFASTVAQPLLGTQAMVFVSPRLRLFARADLGGFGLNNADDYSWNAQAGVGYAIGQSTQLNLSWRYLHLGGSNGQVPENAYSTNQNGLELGVKVFF